VKKVGAQFDEATTTITQAYKQKRLLKAILKRTKANELEL